MNMLVNAEGVRHLYRLVSVLAAAFLTISITASPTAHAQAESGRFDAREMYRALQMPCEAPGRPGDAHQVQMLRQVEELMIAVGWVLPEPDGIPDRQTTGAINIWKDQNGWTGRGISCLQLVERLRSELAAAQRSDEADAASRFERPVAASEGDHYRAFYAANPSLRRGFRTANGGSARLVGADRSGLRVSFSGRYDERPITGQLHVTAPPQTMSSTRISDLVNSALALTSQALGELGEAVSDFSQSAPSPSAPGAGGGGSPGGASSNCTTTVSADATTGQVTVTMTCTAQ